MELTRLIQVTVILVLCFCVVVSKNDENKPTASTIASKLANTPVPTSPTQKVAQNPKSTVVTNSSCIANNNCTKPPGDDSIFNSLKNNKGMLLRTLYVLIGVTSIVVLYFVVRAWRIRRRRSRSRKYGLITSRGSDMEMAPLDADDEDEDMTVFEMNGRTK